MLLNCGVGEDSWESLGLQGDQTSQSSRKSVLNVHWKDWCWSWNSNTLVTWCEELTHWKRHWCRERLKAEEGDDRGWDGWTASPTQWTWVWANSGSWWWTGKPDVLQSIRLQRVGHYWATELNWETELTSPSKLSSPSLILGASSWVLPNHPDFTPAIVLSFQEEWWKVECLFYSRFLICHWRMVS